MPNRKFDGQLSEDQGHTWRKIRAVGWAISDVKGEELEDDYGYAIALDYDGTMVDVGIPERMFKLMIKDINKLRLADEKIGRTKGVQVNHPSSGTKDQS